MTAPWWVLTPSPPEPIDYVASAWLWGILLAGSAVAVWVASRIAEERVGGRRRLVADKVAPACLGAMFWPVVLVFLLGWAVWEGLVRVLVLPHRVRLARARAREARTPEALARRAQRVRADICRELDRTAGDPELVVVRARLEAALADLERPT